MENGKWKMKAPQAQNFLPGRAWNAGDNLICGTSKDLLMGYTFVSLFLCTLFNIFARVPLPLPSGALSLVVRLPLAIVNLNRSATPRERGLRLRRWCIFHFPLSIFHSQTQKSAAGFGCGLTLRLGFTVRTR